MVCASGSLSSSERTKNFLNANGLFYNHDHPFLDFFIQGIDIKAIEIEAIEIEAIEIKAIEIEAIEIEEFVIKVLTKRLKKTFQKS